MPSSRSAGSAWNHTIRRRWLMGMLLLSIISSGAPDQQRLSIYSSLATYSLPVVEHNGQDYVGLLELLDPLGTTTAKVDHNHWKLQYNAVELEFTADKTRVKMHSGDFDLPANFVLENGRGLVPLSALSNLLPRILGGPVSLNLASRRLFIGNAGIHFTAQVVSPNPPRLVMNFSSTVNPTIHQEPGKLRLVFERDPIVAPGSALLTFGNATIPSASYKEENGAAEISIAGTVPLFASVSNEGRTITVTTSSEAQATAATAPVPPTPAPERHYYAVVDASHGGSERGAALNDQITEKDVTLAFARRLRQELESRGINTLLIREGDTNLSLDQRTSIVNAVHPAIYICIHAGSQGNGVRLYTALLPSTGENRGLFVDWNTAQAAFRSASQTAETSLVAQLQKNQIPVRSLQAALRPLNNVMAAAIAVEVSPQQNDVRNLLSPLYQQAVASSLANGIATVRANQEAGR